MNPDLLQHLHAGWQPGHDDLASAEVVSFWQVRPTGSGPYILQGVLDHASGTSPFIGPLAAIDLAAGWAVAGGCLLVLGERAPEVCMALSTGDVLQRASTRPDEGAVLRIETEALASRARRAGFPTLAYLLERAALEADRDEADA
jgi:hypothetical protein